MPVATIDMTVDTMMLRWTTSAFQDFPRSRCPPQGGLRIRRSSRPLQWSTVPGRVARAVASCMYGRVYSDPQDVASRRDLLVHSLDLIRRIRHVAALEEARVEGQAKPTVLGERDLCLMA